MLTTEEERVDGVDVRLLLVADFERSPERSLLRLGPSLDVWGKGSALVDVDGIAASSSLSLVKSITALVFRFAIVNVNGEAVL